MNIQKLLVGAAIGAVAIGPVCRVVAEDRPGGRGPGGPPGGPQGERPKGPLGQRGPDGGGKEGQFAPRGPGGKEGQFGQQGQWGGRGDKPMGDRPMGDKPMGDRPMGDRPMGDRPMGDRPMGDKPMGDRPAGGPGASGDYSPQQVLGQAEALNGRPLSEEQRQQIHQLVEIRNAAVKKAQEDFRRGTAQVLGKSVEELDARANAMQNKQGQGGDARSNVVPRGQK